MNYTGAQSAIERLKARRAEYATEDRDLIDVVEWLFENCGPIVLGHIAARAFWAPPPEPNKRGRKPNPQKIGS